MNPIGSTLHERAVHWRLFSSAFLRIRCLTRAPSPACVMVVGFGCILHRGVGDVLGGVGDGAQGSMNGSTGIICSLLTTAMQQQRPPSAQQLRSRLQQAGSCSTHCMLVTTSHSLMDVDAWPHHRHRSSDPPLSDSVAEKKEAVHAGCTEGETDPGRA
eukprot:COSAG01_NODE_15_length_40797_cov_245.690550_30_plen_158_part_00